MEQLKLTVFTEVNPRLPEVFRVTLLPEVGYIIPQSGVSPTAPRAPGICERF